MSGFNAPNPVTVLYREMIDSLGIVYIGEAVGQLPANNPQVSAVNTSVGSVNDYVTGSNIGAQLANLRGLNPFFGTRTLTLVDGHRFVPSTNGGSVDLGLIPSNLVARTEVVTGGASAAYGSDAVAGVVNVVLDHELEGLKAQADYSQTERGDGEDAHFSIAGGMKLFGGRGHLIAGAEYDDSKGIGSCTDTRSWCKPYAIFNTPQAYESQYPDYFLTDNARAVVSGTGTILAMTSFQSVTTAPAAAFTADNDYANMPASLRNRQFNDAGTSLVNWQTGEFISPANRVMVGGEGLPQDFGTQLRVPVERTTFYTRFQYDLTDRVQGFFEASYGQRQTDREQIGLQYSILGTTTSGALIKGSTCTTATITTACAPNAFVPASVLSLMDINGNGLYTQGIDKDGFYLGKANTTFPAPIQHSDNETYRGVIGLNGSFLETFRWDAYYTYGKNKQEQALENARKDSRGATNGAVLGLPRLTGACQAAATRPTGMTAAEAITCGVNQWTVSPFDFAIDAIVDRETVITPETGQIVCRATLNPSATVRQLASGCVPLNLMGSTNASAAALAYAFGTEYESYEYTQNAVGWNIQGAPIEGWASPIAFAVGMEYRDDESGTTHPDPQNFWAPDFGGDFAGQTEVLEGYVETQFALLKDVPMARSLDFNAAYRRTRNESSVEEASKTFNIDTWKVISF
jgi:outer membrane receptor protein involved in Fe transport